MHYILAPTMRAGQNYALDNKIDLGSPQTRIITRVSQTFGIILHEGDKWTLVAEEGLTLSKDLRDAWQVVLVSSKRS